MVTLILWTVAALWLCLSCVQCPPIFFGIYLKCHIKLECKRPICVLLRKSVCFFSFSTLFELFHNCDTQSAFIPVWCKHRLHPEVHPLTLMKTSFHKLNCRITKQNQNVLFSVLAAFSVTVTKMDVYICDYLWIQYIMYSMIFISAYLKCTFALSRY